MSLGSLNVLRIVIYLHFFACLLHYCLSTYCRRAFSVASPAAWNCLCDELREPLLTANSFRQLLETRLFAEY